MYMQLKYNSQPKNNPAAPANDVSSGDNQEEAENISSQTTSILATEAASEDEITTVNINAEATETNTGAQTSTVETNVPTTTAQGQTTTTRASKKGKGKK